MLRRIVSAGVCAAFLLVAATAHSANWYVDGGASGTGSGTSWANAWKTFSAISWTSVQPGDTIFVSGGTSGRSYTGFTVGKSGTQSAPITIRCGQDAGHTGKVTINGQISFGARNWVTVSGELNGTRNMRVTNPSGSGVYASSPTGLRILYLEILNCGSGVGHHGVAFNPPNQAAGPLHTEVAFCDIRNAWQDGVNATQGRAYTYGEWSIHDNNIINVGDDGIQVNGGVDIYNNVIRDCVYRTGHPDGLQLVRSYLRIYNNIVANFDNSCIFLTTFGAKAGYWQVYNNLVYCNDTSWNTSRAFDLQVIKDYSGQYISHVDIEDMLFANNTVVAVPKYHGLSLWKREGQVGTVAAKNLRFINNIFHDVFTGNLSGTPVSLPNWGTQQDIVFDYNIISGPNKKVVYRGVKYTSAEALNSATIYKNNSSQAPTFVNAAGNNYRLADTDAVALDRGMNLASLFSSDIDKVLRPQGPAWDIGAYERLNASQPPPPPPPVPEAPRNLRVVP